MTSRRKFDKHNSTTFSLVYRAQSDPRIHDAEASDMVFAEKSNPNANRARNRLILDEEFGGSVRGNEGEAATHGVYFDDSEYDYMQHLRDIDTSREARFLEAPITIKDRGKQKTTLEDALKQLDFCADEHDGFSQASSRISLAESLLPEEMLPSDFVQKNSYQNQQNVPDAIAGFQPDMDSRLREVLEALDDDAYVDDDEDLFNELQQNPEELAERRWKATEFTDEDDDWMSDHTVKAENNNIVLLQPSLEEGDLQTVNQDEEWIKEFRKFKSDEGRRKAQSSQTPAGIQSSSIHTGATSIAGLRRKKRKGALTATTGYSMTSSVLRRTEELSILDQRFDRIQEQYNDEDDTRDDSSLFSQSTSLSRVSALSTASNASGAPSLVRTDFDSIIDEFLDGYTQVGKQRMRRGKPQHGLQQLDEIREELGPARLKTPNATTIPTA